MSRSKNLSYIGRILAEVSWEKATKYHNGGIGFENVLTAEVMQGLDYLPRTAFLAAVLKRLHGCESDESRLRETRDLLVEECEHILFSYLPFESYYLRPERKEGNIQPDCILASPRAFVLVEAKRIRRSKFSPGQLAKEYVLTMREAGNRRPLVVLVLGQKPPINVARIGPRSIKEAISDDLAAVVGRAESLPFSPEELLARISETVAWITWDEIAEAVECQMRTFRCDSRSTYSCIDRVANSVLGAIIRHGPRTSP